jgi:hypothetical protein
MSDWENEDFERNFKEKAIMVTAHYIVIGLIITPTLFLWICLAKRGVVD